MLITFFSPFGVYYGIKLAREREYQKHRKIQNSIFILCITGLLALETLIRFSGGSGSLASESDYYHTGFFKITLTSHIIVAVLTYLLWTVLVLVSNRKFRKSLPGTVRFSQGNGLCDFDRAGIYGCFCFSCVFDDSESGLIFKFFVTNFRRSRICFFTL